MVLGFLFRKRDKKTNARQSKRLPVQKSRQPSAANKSSKKTVRKAIRSKLAKTSPVKEVLIGKITHFFPKVGAGVIKLKTGLAIRDTIHIKGCTSDFNQNITSLQINNKPVKKAPKGKLVGFLSARRVRRNDKVYKLKNL